MAWNQGSASALCNVNIYLLVSVIIKETAKKGSP